ncbi:MAG TPA: MFS transporter [Candidatus Nitrosocosmicus sp.]
MKKIVKKEKVIETNRNFEFNNNPSLTPTKILPSAWKVLVILSCIATMVMYAETMLIPAIPNLIKDFHVSYGLSSWLLTAYLISGAVMTPIAGKLSDIYGRKRILLIIMGIYTVGVICGGFAPNIYVLVITRAIQGIGMAMFPIAFGMVRDQFPREKVSIAQGAITSMFAVGSVIGLSIGGIIIQNFGWRTTFFTIIPISIILILIIRKYIHLTNSDNDIIKKNTEVLKIKEQKMLKNKVTNAIDIKGSVLLAVTITSFLLALTLLQNTSDNNPNLNSKLIDIHTTLLNIIPFLFLGTISLSLFIYVEKHTKSPLIDFKIFIKPQILIPSTIIMIVGFSMFMVFQTIPILIQTPKPIGFSESPIDTGRVQLPFAIVLLLFGPTSGIIISKLGSLRPVIFGSILTTFSFAIILLFHSSELLISIGLGILSAGLSLAAVGAMNIIILSSPRQYSGVTIGMSSMLRIVGSSIGPALAAMYMQTNQSQVTINGIRESLPSSFSFDLIFLSAALLSIVSIILSISLNKKNIMLNLS